MEQPVGVAQLVARLLEQAIEEQLRVRRQTVARHLDPEHWPQIAAEMLLTVEPDEEGSRPSLP